MKNLQTILKSESNKDLYELFKFRTLIILTVAESEYKQTNLKKFYDFILKCFYYNLNEFKNFTEDDYDNFTKHASLSKKIKNTIKKVINILESKFESKIP